jgi:hypothetical protein
MVQLRVPVDLLIPLGFAVALMAVSIRYVKRSGLTEPFGGGFIHNRR